jgi:hypothetical protein
MKVIDVLEKIQTLDKKIVKVEGFLMSTGEYVYIAPDMNSYAEISSSIQISEPDFMDKVQSTKAPASGGGVTLYPYDIVVEGKLHYLDGQPFLAAVDDITAAYLISNSGNRYQVV